MSTPTRVQLSRHRGWRKPENTVVVSKPTMWGNPFWKGSGCRMTAAWSYKVALMVEILLLRLGAPPQNHHMRKIAEHIGELRGKNLACWCPTNMPDEYCHAGVLLAVANKENRTVHLEPEHFRRWPSEDCSECGKPTRYWLTPHVPLCQDCAQNKEPQPCPKTI